MNTDLSDSLGAADLKCVERPTDGAVACQRYHDDQPRHRRHGDVGRRPRNALHLQEVSKHIRQNSHNNNDAILDTVLDCREHRTDKPV